MRTLQLKDAVVLIEDFKEAIIEEKPLCSLPIYSISAIIEREEGFTYQLHKSHISPLKDHQLILVNEMAAWALLWLEARKQAVKDYSKNIENKAW